MDMLMKLRKDLMRMRMLEDGQDDPIAKGYRNGIDAALSYIDLYLECYFDGLPKNFPVESK